MSLVADALFLLAAEERLRYSVVPSNCRDDSCWVPSDSFCRSAATHRWRIAFPGPNGSTSDAVVCGARPSASSTSSLGCSSGVTSEVYSSPLCVAKGQNPIAPTSDGIFSDGVTYQMCTVTEHAASGGYSWRSPKQCSTSCPNVVVRSPSTWAPVIFTT